MKNFVINLPQSIDRRKNVTDELNKIGIIPNFIEAVYGKDLSDAEWDTKVIKSNYLTPGEVGCALSHLKVFKIMIDENIPYAMIFEDDIVVTNHFKASMLNKLLDFIISIPKTRPAVINLFDVGFKAKKIKQIDDNTVISTPTNSFTTHAYIINLQAAKNILEVQTPLKFEIDAWKFYKYLHKLTIYCTQPSLIEQNSEYCSIILKDGKINFRDRKRVNNKNSNFNLLFKQLSFLKKLKTYGFKIYKMFT